jgi:hypothetical protein
MLRRPRTEWRLTRAVRPVALSALLLVALLALLVAPGLGSGSVRAQEATPGPEPLPATVEPEATPAPEAPTPEPTEEATATPQPTPQPTAAATTAPPTATPAPATAAPQPTATATAAPPTPQPTLGIAPIAAPATINQCANGPAPSPNSDGCAVTGGGNVGWVTGSLGQSNSVYYEGDSVPYRVSFGSVSLAAHTVTIERDTTKGGKHALDQITSFNRTVADANPCLGFAGCDSYPVTTFPIPPDPQVTGAGVTPAGGVRGGRHAEAPAVPLSDEGLRRAQHGTVGPPGGRGGRAVREAAARRVRPVPREEEQVGGERVHRRVLGPLRHGRRL